MQPIHFDRQETAQPLDAETKAAVDLGLEQLRRGETVTLEQSDRNLKERLKAWRKIEIEVPNA